MGRREWIVVHAAVGLGLMACTDPPSVPAEAPGLYFLGGHDLTDTVDASAGDLVIRAIGPDGPRAGLEVVFQSLGYFPEPVVLTLVAGVPGPLLTVTTDTEGEAKAPLKFGQVVGAATVRVSVPDLGYSRDAAYSIQPGQVSRVVALPQDTVVRPGQAFVARSFAHDRYGNTLSAEVGHLATSANVSVTGRMIRVSATGRGTVVARLGEVHDTMVVTGVLDLALSTLTRSELHLISLADEQVTVVPLGAIVPSTADWSPDGQWLLFHDELEGGIWITDSLGHRRPFLEGYRYSARAPKYSPDGAWIYYHEWRDDGWRIRRIRPDGTGDETPPIPADRRFPSAAPDGRHVAVVFLPEDGRLPRLETFDLVSKEEKSLTNGHSPAWSPTEELIAFIEPVEAAVWVIRPDGGGLRRISPPGDRFWLGLDWSPDGLLLVGYSEAFAAATVFNVATGSIIRLLQTEGVAPAWK